MQQYKSTKNNELDRKHARRLEKQRGEIPFEVEANNSARIITKFPKEYAELPYIHITTLVSSGDEFEVLSVMTGRTKVDFTVNVQNTGIKPIKGSILWIAE